MTRDRQFSIIFVRKRQVARKFSTLTYLFYPRPLILKIVVGKGGRARARTAETPDSLNAATTIYHSASRTLFS